VERAALGGDSRLHARTSAEMTRRGVRI